MSYEFEKQREKDLIRRLDRLDGIDSDESGHANVLSKQRRSKSKPRWTQRVMAAGLAAILIVGWIGYRDTNDVVVPAPQQTQTQTVSNEASPRATHRGSIRFVKADVTDHTNSEISFAVTVGIEKDPYPLNVNAYTINRKTYEQQTLTPTSCEITPSSDFKQYRCTSPLSDRIESGTYQLKIEATTGDQVRFTTTGQFSVTR